MIATKPRPFVFLGAAEAAAGIAILVIEIISITYFGYTMTSFAALPLGALYIITGSFAIAAGASFRPTSAPNRCTVITALTLGVLSLVSAIALIVHLFVLINTLESTPNLLQFYVSLNGPNIVIPHLCFAWIVVVFSIAIVILSARALTMLKRETVLVTQVARPGFGFVHTGSAQSGVNAFPPAYPPQYKQQWVY